MAQEWFVGEDPETGDRVLTRNNLGGQIEGVQRWRHGYGFEELLAEALETVRETAGWRRVGAYPVREGGDYPTWYIRPMFTHRDG